MRTSIKAFIVLFTLTLIGFTTVRLAYEPLYTVLPPSISQRLPDLAADVATALPAPRENSAEMGSDQLVAIPGAAEPTATPLPNNTLQPIPTNIPESIIETAVIEVAATETPLPTATPLPTDIPPTQTPTATPLPLAFTLDGLQNIPQTFNNCGPANVSIVLNYHGDSTAQETTALTLKPNPNDRNVSPWQIGEYINGGPNSPEGIDGLKVAFHSGGTEPMLKQLIAIGLPPVVERGIDFNDGEGWYGHYLTLFGYDDDSRIFNAMDTYAQPWAPNGEPFAYDDVLGSWKDFNYTFFVVYPVEREVEVQMILGETLLDEMVMWENTATIAREQIRADVTDKFAWFNLGTSLTELGILTGEAGFYEEGVAAFDEARKLDLPYRMLWYQHRPYMAYFKIGRNQDVIDLANATLETRGGRNVEETYLWLGHALTAINDPLSAGNAYRESLKVNTNFYPAQTALNWLTRDGG
ncbi:MAG: C39 family peptidase [Candidatus Promineifilaceae bacterium]